MLGLVRYQKEEKHTKKQKKKNVSVQQKWLHERKKHRKTNGKYIETLHANISNQISAKIFFNAGIADLC